MRLKIYVEPAIEPVSLQELKDHLRLSSGSFADNLTTIQSIAPGSHAVANNFTTHVGNYVDVLGYSALVILDVGANIATGTVEVKIQESDVSESGYTDWTEGNFTKITMPSNAVYEKAYTGTKQYIRVVARVLIKDCEFGVSIAKYASDATEDDLLMILITTARQHVEAITRRALITQTWDAFLDEFPDKPYIKLPLGQLQSITTDTFIYTNSAGTDTKMAVTTDYLVDSSSEPGRIVLPYGVSWPSFTPYPVNPITFRFIAGYGDISADVPAAIRTAIKMFAADLYELRETQIVGQTLMQNKAAENLLGPYRLWEF